MNMNKEKMICFGIIIILGICLLSILYMWGIPSEDGRYYYEGVKTEIIFDNITLSKQDLYNFLSTNSNISIEQPHNYEEVGASFNHIRFRYKINNYNFDKHNFVVWMDSDINNEDFTITYYYYSNNTHSNKNRNDVKKSSEQFFELDKQISENITNKMTNEFVLLIGKHPKPFELNKLIEKRPLF